MRDALKLGRLVSMTAKLRIMGLGIPDAFDDLSPFADASTVGGFAIPRAQGFGQLKNDATFTNQLRRAAEIVGNDRNPVDQGIGDKPLSPCLARSRMTMPARSLP